MYTEFHCGGDACPPFSQDNKIWDLTNQISQLTATSLHYCYAYIKVYLFLHLNVDMQSQRPQSGRTMNSTEQDRQSKFLSESESSVVSSCTSICVHAYPANCACVQGPVQSLSLVSYQWRSLDSAHCYETVFISNESSWVPSSGRGWFMFSETANYNVISRHLSF